MSGEENELMEELCSNKATTSNRKLAKKRSHQFRAMQTKNAQETSPVRKKIKNKENISSQAPPGARMENKELLEKCVDKNSSAGNEEENFGNFISAESPIIPICLEKLEIRIVKLKNQHVVWIKLMQRY